MITSKEKEPRRAPWKRTAWKNFERAYVLSAAVRNHREMAELGAEIFSDRLTSGLQDISYHYDGNVRELLQRTATIFQVMSEHSHAYVEIDALSGCTILTLKAGSDRHDPLGCQHHASIAQSEVFIDIYPNFGQIFADALTAYKDGVKISDRINDLTRRMRQDELTSAISGILGVVIAEVRESAEFPPLLSQQR